MVFSIRPHLISLGVVISALGVVHSGWIDPDTPASSKQTRSFTDGEVYDLVMSDEFNKPGRKFLDGHDPMWTAVERSDDDQTSGGKKSLQFYNSSYAFTEDGSLVLLTTDEDTKWRGYDPYTKKYTQLRRHFRSGMLQSWNKFCFTGGIFEADIMLPGSPRIGGLWPAVWLLGNLGRATFEASTNLIWPWSYPSCDRSLQNAQLLSGCDVTEHFELHPGQGRGATEIDIVEVMPGEGALPLISTINRPYNSMTLQLAPGVPSSMKRPQFFTLPSWGFTWYQNLTYGPQTSVNPFFYGSYLGPTSKVEPVQRSPKQVYQCDALSAISEINDAFWSGMHTFRLEWQPGENGYLHWYIDGVYKYGIEQDGLDFMKTKIPNEPSSIIFNTAISTSWGFPAAPPTCTEIDCKTLSGRCGMNPGFCATLPAKFKIDNVRVYQRINDSTQTTGCNPEGYPTSKFIDANKYNYMNFGDENPLKPISTGGGRCQEQSNSCGEHYGSGVCVSRACKCSRGWVGPHCLVPHYFDDGRPWDQTENELPAIQPPEVPPALIIYGSLFISGFIATAVAIALIGPLKTRSVSTWL